MTTIDFYTHVADPLAVAARLVAKAHAGPAAVLVNLHAEPPPFFSRFERLAEIVGVDGLAAGRERFRFYRERGYEMRTHDLRERA